ncbi:hypothetical protein BY458DRAFT_511579 [Sporodiniella umbellata]|nr:hypothetical protein BY458DRAFT_511579 [Sporodiniella umbellata]
MDYVKQTICPFFLKKRKIVVQIFLFLFFFPYLLFHSPSDLPAPLFFCTTYSSGLLLLFLSFCKCAHCFIFNLTLLYYLNRCLWEQKKKKEFCHVFGAKLS